MQISSFLPQLHLLHNQIGCWWNLKALQCKWLIRFCSHMYMYRMMWSHVTVQHNSENRSMTCINLYSQRMAPLGGHLAKEDTKSWKLPTTAFLASHQLTPLLSRLVPRVSAYVRFDCIWTVYILMFYQIRMGFPSLFSILDGICLLLYWYHLRLTWDVHGSFVCIVVATKWFLDSWVAISKFLYF